MRCRRAQRLLSRRIDGALSPVDSAALESHLAGCAACRLATGPLGRAWSALDILDGDVAPPEDWARIEAAAVARSQRWAPLWLRWPLVPIPAAVGALAAMVVLGATGGALLSEAALRSRRADPIESRVVTENLGDLPWGSPAAGLARVLGGELSQEKGP